MKAPSDAVHELDLAPRVEAVERLRICCGASRWVETMADQRPFGDLEALIGAADAAWAELKRADWREAIEHHPRLGGSDLAARKFDATRSLSREEQARVLDASQETRAVLARAQREYEERFGFIFLIRASGRSAAEILSELERRMTNDLETELAVAAGQLEEIGRMRLERQFGGEGDRDGMSITTHVLDTSRGQPASGIRVHLETRDGDGWRELGSGQTDEDGRASELIGDGCLEPGTYRIRFATGEYFQALGIESFHPEVAVVFRIGASGERYHVPLLVSPFGYTTYRGS